MVFVVIFDAVVEGADLFFLQEARNAFFELTAAFARDDLNGLDVLGNGFFDDCAQFALECVRVFADRVKVESKDAHDWIIPLA